MIKIALCVYFLYTAGFTNKQLTTDKNTCFNLKEIKLQPIIRSKK